jgi:branched-chain amino acid transport system permease protein
MKKKKQIILVTIIAIILIAFPALKPDVYYLAALFTLFMYAALSSSWNLFGGTTGYMNFGHAAFFGLGAYTSALLLMKFGLSPFYTCLFGGIIAAVIAGIISYPTLRLRGSYFVLVTLCLGLSARLVIINLEWTGSSNGLYLPFLKVDMFTNKVIFYEVMLAIMGLMIVISKWIENSKFGLGLRSIFYDEDSAGTQGVNARLLKTNAYILSAFTGGVIGGIYSYYRGYIHPDFIFDINISILVILMSLFGGRHKWHGPIIGAAIIVTLNEFLSGYAKIGAEVSRIIYGLLLVIVIMYLPNGLIGLFKMKRNFNNSRT